MTSYENISLLRDGLSTTLDEKMESSSPGSDIFVPTSPSQNLSLSMEQVGKLLTALELLRTKGTDSSSQHSTYRKCLTVLQENSDFFRNPLPYLQSLPVARNMAPYLLDKQVLDSIKGVDLVRIDGLDKAELTNAVSETIINNRSDNDEVKIEETAAISIPPVFTEANMELLAAQIQVYKYIARSMKVPDHLQKLVIGDVQSISPKTLASSKSDASLSNKILNASRAVQLEKAEVVSHDPYKLLQRQMDMRRMLIPSITPAGIDPKALREERERRIRTRISSRIRELGELPSNLPDDVKRRAFIELKALHLLDRQKKLRMELLTAVNRAMTLETSLDRASYRRFKKQSVKEAKLTERLERQHRLEREKKERLRNQEFLANVLQHSRYLKDAHRQTQARAVKLGRAVLQYHTNLEKEEQRRQERVERERIKALRADDEEAYLKLIDQKKDTRITHLLRQTDSYLASLAKLVLEQKRADDLGGSDKDRHHEEEELFETNRDGVREYYQIAHSIQEEIEEQPSILVNGHLKEYQMRGLQWLVSLYNNNLNGILADEMGLGKTIQTIALVSYLMETKKQNGPFLVTVPLSTLTNWVLEFEKWAPSVTKIVYKGTPGVRRQIYQQQMKNAKFNVLLTTYEYIIRDRSMLAKVKWSYLVVDEGHRMKNTHCKLTQILSQYYHCRHRLLLTGTPLQNSLPELWALLNFLLPKIFNSVKNFEEWFNMPFANTGERVELNEEEKLLVIRRLHKVLRPFLLRRLKKDVESELPDKVERVIKCQLSALQKHLCTEIKRIGLVYTQEDDQKRRRIFARGLNNTIMQLRKVCNHPFVFPEIEKQINPHKMTDELIFRVSGKFELLDRILPKLHATGHKVLMFFQMTQVMTIMEDFCNWRQFSYLRLDGATKSEERSELLSQFNSPTSTYFLFLLSTRAGGLGLNLQSADTVIIFDSDWNPHQDLQAQDRAHRIGQTKEVRIFRLISIDSVEEHILARAQYKLNVDEKVIQAGKFDQKSTAEEREEVLRTLFEQDPEESEMGDGVWDDDELNEVLARGEHEITVFRQLDKERTELEYERWKASGMKKSSGPLSRLIESSELPPLYLDEAKNGLMSTELGNGASLEDAVGLAKVSEETTGRRRRAKINVIYDDGLSEEQFLRTIEEGKDLREVIENKRKRKQSRLEKLKKQSKKSSLHAEQTQPDMETSEHEVIDEDDADSNDHNDDLFNDDHDHHLHYDEAASPKVSGTTPRHRKMPRYSSSREGSDRDIERQSDQRNAGDEFTNLLMKLYTMIEKSYADSDEDDDIDDEEDQQRIGRQRSYLFLTLPSKRVYPDYYVAIKQPISMNEIRQKLEDHVYQSTQEFLDDFDLMFSNAMHYNVEGSEVYEDAVYLRSLLHDKINNLFPDGPAFRDDYNRHSKKLDKQSVTSSGLKLSIRLPTKSKVH